MNVQMANKAVELTQETLVRFWQKDYKFLEKFFTDDITLIGSLQEQYVQGIEKVDDILYRTTLQHPSCHLMEQEFMVASNCGSACTVIGRYLTTTDDTADYFVQSQQRCTYVWELIKGQLMIRHFHISDPMGQLTLKEGELFAGTIGKMATEYYLRKARNLNDDRRITIKGKGDITHFFSFSEIICVTAIGRDIEIHTCNRKNIIVHMSITDFIEKTKGDFVLIHRCHAINPDYVIRIEKYQITMIDETILPIPVRKYVEIRDMLLGSYGSPEE